MGSYKSHNSYCNFLINYSLKIPINGLFLILFIFPFIVFANAQNQNKNSDLKKQRTEYIAPKIIIAGKPTVTTIKDFTVSNSLSGKTIKGNEKVSGEEVRGIANFSNYNTEEGLSLSSISCGISDRDGNLWFGTYGGGVCRYDGKSFITLTAEQGLTNNNVVCILEDKKGNIWFGTNGGGVSCYNGKVFKSYTINDGLPNNNVLSICEDKKGNLWFGTDGYGASCFDGKKFTNYGKAQGLADSLVWSIMEDNKGNLWFGTNSGGISRFNGKTFITYNKKDGFSSNSSYKIFQDKKGNIWIASRGGFLSCYDGKIFKNYSEVDGFTKNIINCIHQDKKGILWFGTSGGGLISFNGKIFTSYTSEQGLVHNGVTAIIEDASGNLWLGTNGGGVCRFNGKSFTSYTIQQGLPNNCIWSILEDKLGFLWFGSEGLGLSRFNGNSFQSYSNETALVDYNISSIVEDNDGKMWFGTYGGGISCLDGKILSKYTSKQGLSNDYITYILQDKTGIFWFGTYGAGIIRFDGKFFTFYTSKQGLSNDYITSILEDKKGNLWVGTDGGGLNLLINKTIPGTSFFMTYTKENGLAHNSIHNLIEDNTGNLWIATAGGISRFNGKSFTNYTTTQGLSDNFVTQVLQDKEGRLFFGSNWGISVISAWKDNVPVFENFSKRTGYPVKDVNIGQNTMYLDSKGIIWAATGDDKTALVRFDYSEVNRNPNPLKLFIQNILINEEKVCWYSFSIPEFKIDSTTIAQQELMCLGRIQTKQERENFNKHFSNIRFNSIRKNYPVPENLELPYNHNHITFEFAAIEPSRPSMVNYQYFLKGYDKDWSPISNRTNAVFGNIHEGKYTFMLKAQSPDGIWSEPIIYTFEVLPPWYRTIWAYLSYLFAVLFIFYIGIRKYTFNLQNEKILLESIVKERTEEIQSQLVVLNQEIDIRKNAEKMLLEREVQLNELNATKDKLFSIVAHDLRSPFSGILGFLQLLQDTIDTNSIARSEELLSHIYSATKNTYNLLETLLDWAKTQTSQIAINVKKLDISFIINGNLSDFQPITLNKKINLTYSNPVYVDVLADENILNSIIRNLISNAIKYSKIGDSITISVNINGNFAEISVADNGIGIKSELKNSIFSSSVNQSISGTANEKGTGLGLIICKEFTEKLGGKIWVESEVGKGTCFTFSIPLFKE